MLKFLEVTSKTENLWNEVLENSDNSTPYATLKWNYLLSKAYSKCVFIGIIGVKRTDPVVIFPLTLSYPIGPTFSLALDGFGGPIVRSGININEAEGYASEIIQYVCKRYFRYYFEILLPPWSNEEIKQALLNNNFTLIKSKDNYIIDLTKNLNDIRLGYSTHHKKNIKQALNEKSLSIREASSSKDCEKFFLQYKETLSKVNKHPVYNLMFLKYSYILIEADIGKLYFAEYNGNTVAGVYVLYDKKNIFGWLACSSTSKKYRKFGMSYLIYDHIIEFAKSRNLRLFIWGAAPTESLARFKQGWGSVLMPNLYFSIRKKGCVGFAYRIASEMLSPIQLIEKFRGYVLR